MWIEFHFRKEYLLIFICIFVGIIQQIYIQNVQVIVDLALLFNHLSMFCLIICYFIEKRISKSKIQIKEKFKLILFFIFMFVFLRLSLIIEFTVNQYDIDVFRLLLQIINYLYI